MKIDLEEVQQMIADCHERQSKLTDWEIGFIDSLEVRIGKGFGCSDKQYERLSEAWERVT